MKKLIIFIFCVSPFLSVAQTSEATSTKSYKKVFKDSLGNVMTREQMESYLADNEDAGVKLTRGEGNEMVMSLKSKQEVRENRKKLNLDPEEFSRIINGAFNTKFTGHVLPDLSFKDVMGNYYTANELKGKVVVMNFWFIGCKPCVEEIPFLNKVVEQFYDKNVVFIAPTFDEQEAVNKFLEKRHFNYKIVAGMSDAEMNENYGVKLWPTHIIYDKSGKIDSYLVGGQKNIDQILWTLITHAMTNDIQD